MDCSLPGSSVHGIFQARVLEWVAISFSRGSSQLRDQTRVSHVVDRSFTVWATGKSLIIIIVKLKTVFDTCFLLLLTFFRIRTHICYLLDAKDLDKLQTPWAPTDSSAKMEVTAKIMVGLIIPWKQHGDFRNRITAPLHCVQAKLLQLCPTLCNPMDCRLPGSSVHGILQARILEWVAMPSSRGSSWPRDRTHISYVSCIGRQVHFH